MLERVVVVVVVTFLFAGMGTAAAAQPRIVALRSANAPYRTVTVPLETLGPDAELVQLGGDPTLPGGGQVGRIDCRHALDLRRLRSASLALLRSRRLQPNAYEVEGQLVIVTSPKLSARSGSYYSFIATMAPCVGRCTLRVSAWKITAPFDGTILRMEQAAKENDDITGELMDIGEREFNRCA